MIEISLEAARKNAKFTKSQWANELRTKSSTVTKWEKGEAEPTLTQLRRMSELSGIPVDYLFVPDCSGQERGMTAIEKEERAGLQEELIEIILETKGMPVLQYVRDFMNICHDVDNRRSSKNEIYLFNIFTMLLDILREYEDQEKIFRSVRGFTRAFYERDGDD